ncbi:MAG: hypothetical protein LBG68_01430 [Coriobacteriales bacterium]|jgi:hypothetical protein|nr:hypothetical protein [Coriobacteriales bacterium]
MRKLIALALALLLASSMVACTKDPAVDPPDTTDPPINDTQGPDNSSDNPNNSSNNGSSTNENPSTSNQTDPNDLKNVIAALPDDSALNTIWDKLTGYWVTSENLYIGFIENNDTKMVVYGVWDSESQGYGTLIDVKATGSYDITLTVHYSAMPATQQSGARPEMDVSVLLNLDALTQNGIVSVKIANHGNGNSYQYSYGGKTFDDAYKSAH